MVKWNYRVVRRCVNGEVTISIHEAFYPSLEAQRPASITVEPVAATGESIEELRETLDKPVIRHDDLEEE